MTNFELQHGPQTWTIERHLDFIGHAAEMDMTHRMSQDLIVMQGMSVGLQSGLGSRVIVENGYAIDAACNGRLSRMHYDGDMLVTTPLDATSPDVRKAILDTANSASETQWRLVQEPRIDWITLYEAGKRTWEEGLTGSAADSELAQRINVRIVHAEQPFEHDDWVDITPKPGVTFTKPLEIVALEDTYGNAYSLTVASVNDSTAMKVRWIQAFAEKQDDTFVLRESDYADFRALFASSKFEPNEFLGLLWSFYSGTGVASEDIAGLIFQELQPIIDLVPERVFASLSLR